MNIEDFGMDFGTNKIKVNKNIIPFTKQMYTLTINNKLTYSQSYAKCRKIFKFVIEDIKS